MLGLVVTEALYRAHPDLPEGALAKMRAATVSQRALALVARDLDLGSYVLLGKGELSTGGPDKDSILSDTLEAVFGAVYLSHGVETARTVVERLVGPSLEAAAGLGAGLDWKTSLQELSAALGLGAPSYEVTGEGPDHSRTFTARAMVAGEPRGVGVGPAKKLAEQDAAADAYRVLARAAAALTCPSCPRSRPSATGWRGTCWAARSPASRCAATTASGGTTAVRSTSPAACAGDGSTRPSGAASSSGSCSTRATTPSWRTSG